MTRVTYTGAARLWRTNAHGGLSVNAGETVDVDDDVADTLVSEYAFEYADEVDSADVAQQSDTNADESERTADADAGATDDFGNPIFDADDVAVPDGDPPVKQALVGSVDDLEAALATGAYDGRLDALEDYEREHKDRTTAYAAIDDRREDIRDAQE